MRSSTPSAGGARLALVLALLGACLAGCASSGEERSLPWLINHGQYDQAMRVAEERVADDPDDARARKQLDQVRIAWLLHRAREASFDNDFAEALARIDQALEIDPEQETVLAWQKKTRAQLATQWLRAASDAMNSNDLDTALAAYEQANTYAPGHPWAVDGIARVLLLRNYRAGRSKWYYTEALRSFQELAIGDARYRFDVSDYLRPSPEAAANEERARKMLAQERLHQADQFRSDGLYAAARNEYRLVLLLDPEHAVARQGFNSMDLEVRTSQLLAKAEMHALKGELEKASEVIAEASELTTHQEDRIGRQVAQIDEMRLRSLYDEALNFERDYRYEQAVEAYGHLLAQVEYYEDAIARRETLQWLMSQAEELYGKALAATDPDAFDLLNQIETLIWPGYRDVSERLDELTRRGIGQEVGSQGEAEAPGEGS